MQDITGSVYGGQTRWGDTPDILRPQVNRRKVLTGHLQDVFSDPTRYPADGIDLVAGRLDGKSAVGAGHR
ncbi:MAG: hypothetical protein II336_14685 [Loktanella sp.]|nr:hypothetical protein [Loktanella sp.]